MLEIKFNGKEQTIQEHNHHGVTDDRSTVITQNFFTLIENRERKIFSAIDENYSQIRRSCSAAGSGGVVGSRSKDESSSLSSSSSSLECEWRVLDCGLILDEVCDIDWLQNTVEDLRLSLPLDSKRPTVDRRFIHDQDGIIAHTLESIVANSLYPMLYREERNEEKDQKRMMQRIFFIKVHCNKYLRILEYHHKGGGLSPHTDGSKVCEEFNVPSTHTLLLYLSNCDVGGETILLNESFYQFTNQYLQQQLQKQQPNENDKNKNKKRHTKKGKNKLHPQQYLPDEKLSGKHNNKNNYKDTWKLHENGMLSVNHQNCCSYSNPIYSTKDRLNKNSNTVVEISDLSTGGLAIPPRHGRILLFPHNWPHAGAMIETAPKIMLRAELTLLSSSPDKMMH